MSVMFNWVFPTCKPDKICEVKSCASLDWEQLTVTRTQQDIIRTVTQDIIRTVTRTQQNIIRTHRKTSEHKTIITDKQLWYTTIKPTNNFLNAQPGIRMPTTLNNHDETKTIFYKII